MSNNYANNYVRHLDSLECANSSCSLYDICC